MGNETHGVRKITDPLARTVQHETPGTGVTVPAKDRFVPPEETQRTTFLQKISRPFTAIASRFRRARADAVEPFTIGAPQRLSRASTVPITPGQLPGSVILEAASGARISYFEQGSIVSFFSADPFDIAQILYIVESDGRQVHKPLSAIIDSILHSRQTLIADRFYTKPVYGKNLGTYYADLRLAGSQTIPPQMHRLGPLFVQEAEREVVGAAATEPGVSPSMEDARVKLLELFDRAYHQYAVNREGTDGNITRMNMLRSMFNPRASDDRFGAFMGIMEAGVRLDTEGAVSGFVLRFVRGERPAEDLQVDYGKVITLVGMPAADLAGLFWHVHDNGEFFSPKLAVQGIITDVLRNIFRPETLRAFCKTSGRKSGDRQGPGEGAPPAPSRNIGSLIPSGEAPPSTASSSSSMTYLRRPFVLTMNPLLLGARVMNFGSFRALPVLT